MSKFPRIRTILPVLVLAFCFFSVKAESEELLLEEYRRPVPFTFGLYMDLSLKVKALQVSRPNYRVEAYIGQSGKLQVKIDFLRAMLPAQKDEAEQLIEDTSMKVHTQMLEFARGLWKTYSGMVQGEPFVSQDDYLRTLVYLDGSMIGFSEETRFMWKTVQRDPRPVTNTW